METLLKIFILFLMGISVNGVCLSNLRVKEATNRTITLDWDYSCYAQASSVLFKVYYEHQKFMACRTGKKVRFLIPFLIFHFQSNFDFRIKVLDQVEAMY